MDKWRNIDKVEKLEGEAKEFGKQIETLVTKIGQVKKEKERIGKEIDKLKRENGELELGLEAVKKSEKDYRNRLNVVEEEKVRLEAQIRDLTNQLSDAERKIITQIITGLGLGLPRESELGEVIEEIKKLINKPPTVRVEKDRDLERDYQVAQNTIRELKEKLAEKPNGSSYVPPYTPPSDTPFGEDLKVIVELELTSLKELFGVALDVNTQQKIREATNYSQVVEARQSFLAQHLASLGSVSAPAPVKRNL